MIRRIEKEEVRLGMFVHGLDGSWFKHPFWRSKFLLENPEDLEAIRTSDIAGVFIDEAKGTPLGGGENPMPVSQSPDERRSAPARSAVTRPAKRKPARRATKACDIADEAARAAKIIDSSKIAVRRLFADVRMGKAISLPEILPMVDDISDSVARNSSALISMTRLRSVDEYTYVHSVAVCALMINLGRHLGLEEAMMRDVGMAGLLHDVGKLDVPLDLLNKPGRLTEEEFVVMKSHTERGHEALSSNGNVPDLALDVCLHHHEKIDGSGYPNRLNGEEISLFSKMGSVCDVYDAMTSQRSYKAAWTPAEVISKMYKWRGHFDQHVLDSFIRSIGIFPVGSMVHLESDILAVVVEHNPHALTKPKVRAFCSASDPRIVNIRDIDLTKTSEAILSRADPAAFGFPDFDAEWLKLATEGRAPTYSPRHRLGARAA